MVTKIESLEQGGYDYFMLTEIQEQPNTLRDCMRGRINADEGWIHLGGLADYVKLRGIPRAKFDQCLADPAQLKA